jgi:uncharacterized OB-fold protein
MMPAERVERMAGEVQHLGSVESHVRTTVCRSCGRVHAPARAHRCLVCGSRDLAPGTAPLRGTLESFTEVKAGKEQPVGLALVRLDDGPMLTVHLVLGGPRPEVGARVAGVAQHGAQGVRFHFALEPQALDLPAATETGVRP